MPQAVLGGIDTHWAERPGRGARLALLHCSLASNGSWRKVIAGLDPSIACFAPDLPGHGQTVGDPERPALAQAVASVAALVERAGAPVHIAGHSFGAVVALRLAVDRPELVRSLTLYEPVLFGVLDDVDHPAWLVEQKANAAFGRALQEGPDAAARFFLKRWGAGEAYDDLPAERRAYIRDRIHLIPLSDDALHTRAASRVRRDDLSCLAMPVHLQGGAMTEPVIHAILDVMEAAIPHVTRDRVEGAGHMGPITHPDAKVRALHLQIGIA